MSRRGKKRTLDNDFNANGSNSVEAQSSEKSLAEKLSLFMKTKGDVTFIVGEDKVEIKACSRILSAVSPVFEIMFSEQWMDESKSVPLPDIDPKIFDIFLRLIVTEDLKTNNIQDLQLSLDEILHVLYISKKYDVKSIEKCSREMIKDMMTIPNAISVYERLQFLDEPSLQQEVLEYIEKNARRVFLFPQFAVTSREILTQLLMSDRLEIEEYYIFLLVCRWARFSIRKKGEVVSGKKVRQVLGDLFLLIRFPLMSPQDLVKNVAPTGILTDKELLRLLEYNALEGHENRASKLTEIHFNDTPRTGYKTANLLPLPVSKQFKHWNG